MTLALLAALAIIPVAVFAGRGEGPPLSPDQYRKELVAAFAGVRFDGNATEGEALDQFAGEFRALAKELDGMVPPADAADAHARLVDGLEESADELESLADAGPKGAIEFQQQLAETGSVPGIAW